LSDSVVEEDFNQPFYKVYFEASCEQLDVLKLGRVLFDCKEYRKAAHLLKPFATIANQKALFMYNFCNYLISEQQKEEEIMENNEHITRSSIQNVELVNIENELKPFYEAD
jgi:hypothetical protein